MTDTIRPRRSALFLPASNARAVEKARGLPCDVVIFDLEDAVAPEAKAVAREATVAAVRQGGFGDREVVVRVNSLASEWGEADCAALTDVACDAILVPKPGDDADIAAYRQRLGNVPIWAMVETARAVLRIERLASAPGLAALMMGTNDLAKELRVRPGDDRLPFLGLFTQAVAAARAHGLAIFDGVCNAIDDAEAFAAECAQGVRFGFDGKSLIHPAQIAACNAAFSPRDEEIAWATAVVAAFAAPEAQGRGAIRVDGRMAERLHLAEAEQTLAIARSIGR